jgi:hypothetical protein
MKAKTIMGLAFLMILSVFVTACDEAIPSQYVQLARQSITQAKGADAERYAPADLERAESSYKEALLFIADGDHAHAREMARISLQAADMAAATSRQFYAEEKKVEKLNEDQIVEIENEMAKFIADFCADTPFTEKKAIAFAAKAQAIRGFLILWIGDMKKENTAYDGKDKFLKRLETVEYSLEAAEKMAKEVARMANRLMMR